jgi:hypothetical protein
MRAVRREPLTRTGVLLPEKTPFPSCPVLPRPQQYRNLVVAEIAHACADELEDSTISAGSVSNGDETETGDICTVKPLFPFPSFPCSSDPQQKSFESADLIAHENLFPHATHETAAFCRGPSTGVGITRDVVELSPICPDVPNPQQNNFPSLSRIAHV